MKYLYATLLVDKLGRWLILLPKFTTEYFIKKVIKRRAIIEFLAQQPIEDDQKIDISFPNEEICLIEI